MKDDSRKKIPSARSEPIRLAEDIVATVREPMLVLDESLCVRQANASFFQHFRVKPEETVGQRVFDLGNGQWDIPRLRDLLEKILPESSVFNDFEVQHAFDHIGRRTILLNARRIDDQGLILLAMEDVTRRKQMEKDASDAAREASRAKSEFLSHMSHEIRTPMAVFIPAVEHLLQITSNPEHRKILKMADNSAKRLRALIDNILDFSRLEARQVELKQEPFDVRACVRSAVELFAWQARDKGLRLEREVAADVPHLIVGDTNRLGQVLVNLLGNAVKFTEEGEIAVTVKFHGDFLEFAVADTGIGIPEEKRPLLFRSYSQVDASFESQTVGSGLGLAISKGLVELMGGRIGVHGRPGGGTTFAFSIPGKVAKASPSVRQTRPDSLPEALPAPRILVVEDEPRIRDFVTMTLARRGWKTDSTASGRQALEKWEQGEYDLIFMDLQIPEMDGLETTRAIRQREAGGGRRTCIIGLTAHSGSEIKNNCFEAGMDQVVIKPFLMEDLFSIIESFHSA